MENLITEGLPEAISELSSFWYSLEEEKQRELIERYSLNDVQDALQSNAKMYLAISAVVKAMQVFYKTIEENDVIFLNHAKNIENENNNCKIAISTMLNVQKKMSLFLGGEEVLNV